MRSLLLGFSLFLTLFLTGCGEEAPVGDAPLPPGCRVDTPQNCSPCEVAYLASYNLVKTDASTLSTLLRAYQESGNDPALLTPIITQAQNMAGSCDQIISNYYTTQCQADVSGINTYLATRNLLDACQVAESLLEN